MEKPIVIYTDHIINKTLCYNFAKGSNSLLCHVNNFKDYTKTIATYGVLRGTLEIIRKVDNYYYLDHGYFNQSIGIKLYPQIFDSIPYIEHLLNNICKYEFATSSDIFSFISAN